MYFFIFSFSTLIFYIIYNHVFACVLSNSIDVVAACPKRTTPQYQLYFLMPFPNFYRCYAFYNLCNFRRRKDWNALYQKMYMVVIISYFNKNYFMGTSICWQTSFSVFSTDSLNTFFRYFAGQTK